MGNAMAVISLGGGYDAARAAALEIRVARTDGVKSVEFNYVNNKLTVKFDPNRVGLAELRAIVVQERKHRVRSERHLASQHG